MKYRFMNARYQSENNTQKLFKLYSFTLSLIYMNNNIFMNINFILLVNLSSDDYLKIKFQENFVYNLYD